MLVDQGNGAKVMYPNLFRGLGLKNKDLSKYDTPLVGFDGRMVIPEGQISLPVNMEGKEVIVTFIVVNLFSPYGNSRKAMDSCNGSSSVYIAC